MPGAHEDVTSTLSELERKLVDLERELQSVAVLPSSAGQEHASTLAAAAPASDETALRVGDLRTQIAELVRFRDQLQSTAQELVDEYGRLVDRLQGGGAPATPAPMEPAAPPEGFVTSAPGVTISSPADAFPGPAVPGPAAMAAPATWGETAEAGPSPLAPPPAAPAHAAAPAAAGGPAFEGAVVVDAGPFRDITTLSTFEQALAAVPGAEDVYVRSFEGDRAVIDLRLQGSVPLVEELKTRLSLPITVREAVDGRLSVDVGAESHGS